MLGGVVTAYVKALQIRIGKQEKELSGYKLYVVERYASKEFLERDEKGKFLTRFATLPVAWRIRKSGDRDRD
jgi:hypothetical protein